LKYIALWNNQFERESENVSFNYPCCFIEFTDIVYEDRLNLMQNCIMTVNLHLGFKSFKTTDTSVLTLKQTIHAKIHGLSTNKSTRFLRRAESQNFDHSDWQEYIISYNVTCIDEISINLPSTEAEVDTLITNNDPIMTNHVIRTASPIIPD
jgi:hypothetical protein